MTGRHEGGTAPILSAYAYTGRHEAPAVEACGAFVEVNDGNGEFRGLLVCNRDAHDDPQHYDQGDGILWEVVPASAPRLAALAGAVA